MASSLTMVWLNVWEPSETAAPYPPAPEGKGSFDHFRDEWTRRMVDKIQSPSYKAKLAVSLASK